jgi:hypothetical protein
MNRILILAGICAICLTGCTSTCCRKRACTNCPPGPVIGTTSQSPEILFPSGSPSAAPAVPPPPPLLPEPPRTSGYAPLPTVPPSRVANVPPPPEIRLEKPEFSETTQRTTLRPTSASKELPDPTEVVAAHVATGHRPTLDDLDRLQSNGFRVFFDLSGTTANSSARRVFDNRGLEIRAVDSTNVDVRIQVAKSANGSASPVYVFADDATTLRSWWQSYFKEIELVSDDAAQIRATRLIP